MRLDKKALSRMMDAAAMAVTPEEVRRQVAAAYAQGGKDVVDALGGTEQRRNGGADTPMQSEFRGELLIVAREAEALASPGGGKDWQPTVAVIDEVRPIVVGSRNQFLFGVALVCQSEGKTEEETLAIVGRHNSERCFPPLPPSEVEKLARGARRVA
jgi:hypothetical protein